jgi:hypothetical protein
MGVYTGLHIMLSLLVSRYELVLVSGQVVKMLEVLCSLQIARGFQGTPDNRAKVDMSFVMLLSSRKIAHRHRDLYQPERRSSRALL